jgi:hypothetical protein
MSARCGLLGLGSARRGLLQRRWTHTAASNFDDMGMVDMNGWLLLGRFSFLLSLPGFSSTHVVFTPWNGKCRGDDGIF